jgi:hypothetical protein
MSMEAITRRGIFGFLAAIPTGVGMRIAADVARKRRGDGR